MMEGAAEKTTKACSVWSHRIKKHQTITKVNVPPPQQYFDPIRKEVQHNKNRLFFHLFEKKVEGEEKRA